MANQRVIFSFNVRDFYRLHTRWVSMAKPHAGIVLSKQSYSYGQQMRGLLKLAAAKSLEEMTDQAIFLSHWIS